MATPSALYCWWRTRTPSCIRPSSDGRFTVHLAESFLVLRDGGHVIGLNDSPLGSDNETSLRQTPAPGTKSNRPSLAALALQGTEGVFENDRREGRSSFTAVRNVPGTPWLILVTISQDEILAPVFWDAWNAGIISALLVLATALAARPLLAATEVAVRQTRTR